MVAARVGRFTVKQSSQKSGIPPFLYRRLNFTEGESGSSLSLSLSLPLQFISLSEGLLSLRLVLIVFPPLHLSLFLLLLRAEK